jgi:hypothetical protein
MISSILTVHAQTSLKVTVTTDKQSYNRYDIISISGALTADDQPTNGLVGVYLVDSAGNDLALRTISAGTVNNQLGAITSVYLSDSTGNPASSASAGSLAYFTITVVNKDSVPRDLLAVVSVYDSNGIPLAIGSTEQLQVPSNSQLKGTVSMPIPTWAASGTGYAYGELFSGWPDQGGVPLSQETAVQFTLTGAAQGTNQPPTSSGSQGSYALAFRLPARAALGMDTIYVSSSANGLSASDITSFKVNQPGDFNGDGVLDFTDLTAFANSWIAYYNGQPWNHIADLNGDGKLDFTDLTLFATAWIIYYSAD